jgi:hypothetical protein
VQQIDSQYQIDPNDWATYEAARVQADAAIRAAEIGAQAAKDVAEIGSQASWDAAVLQVLVGAPVAILAAGAALVAGRWAYRAAIHAAETQTRLEKEKHSARIDAYGIRQEALVYNMNEEVQKEINHVERSIKPVKVVSDFYEFIRNNTDININPRNDYYLHISCDEEPVDWKDDQWDNHALLGSSFISCLIITKENHRKVNNMRKYLIEHGKNLPESNIYYIEDIWEDWEEISYGDDGKGESHNRKVQTFNIVENIKIYKEHLLDLRKSLSNLLAAIQGRAPSEGL